MAMIDHSFYVPKVAVLIPCYNEAVAIETVIRDFKAQLPDASIYVYDNNSVDDTVSCALAAGACVRKVPLQGKGQVIRRMFADIEADVYVMVDGDDTYDASSVPQMIETLIREGMDMVVGSRITDEQLAYRPGHRWGNAMLTKCVATLFGRTFEDILSGYRVFSRRYVKSFPAHAAGFEIETELTVHALEMRMPVTEIETRYKSRPDGSESKLNTYRDGWRILLTIFKLFKSEKPLAFFSLGFFVCSIVSLVLSLPVVDVFINTGLVPRLPTALLCAALILLGAMFLTCGLILDTVTHGRHEALRLAYLRIPAPGNVSEPR